MSFGSTNIRALLGKARVAKAFNSFTCTGEGGYPERFIPYTDHVITQVATGLFGVREETIQRARIVEFKYAQGAKPGLGGHLLGDKNTPGRGGHARDGAWASRCSRPFPFHSVYSVEDHKKHLDWIAHVNPRALLSAKVSTPVDVDMVAVGVYYAGGAHRAPRRQLRRHGRGAEHRQEEHRHADRVRDRPRPPVPGGRGHPRQGHGDRQRRHPHARATSPRPSPWAPTACVIGTAELVALGCIRCGACESGRGCARGIATTDDELLEMVSVDWCTQRLVNLYTAWREMLVDILYRLGLDSVAALRGRTDLLTPPGLRRRERTVDDDNGTISSRASRSRPRSSRSDPARAGRFAARRASGSAARPRPRAAAA